MTNDIVEDFLEHHGVKGQRWGVRAAKKVGSGAKKTGTWIKGHKKEAATAAVGIGILAAAALAHKKVVSINGSKNEALGKAMLDSWMKSQRGFQGAMKTDNWPKPKELSNVAKLPALIKNSVPPTARGVRYARR